MREETADHIKEMRLIGERKLRKGKRKKKGKEGKKKRKEEEGKKMKDEHMP